MQSTRIRFGFIEMDLEHRRGAIFIATSEVIGALAQFVALDITVYCIFVCLNCSAAHNKRQCTK